MENDRGDIEIVKTGIYSPFRRYSWFRVGDMIEIINGEKTSVLVLHSLRYHETPWIKYRRGNDISKLQNRFEKNHLWSTQLSGQSIIKIIDKIY